MSPSSKNTARKFTFDTEFLGAESRPAPAAHARQKKTLTNALGFNNGWWRIVGTSASVEFGMRYVVYKPFYLEWSNKQILTNMSNVPVYQGSASQKLRSNEMIFSLGYAFNHFIDLRGII